VEWATESGIWAGVALPTEVADSTKIRLTEFEWADAMSLNIRETPEKVIVTLTDTHILNQEHADTIGQSLRDICRQAQLQGQRVLVNLHQVQFMNSAMISILVGLHKFAKINSIDVRFATSGDVLDVLKITRLTEIFPLDNDDPDLK